VAWWLPKSIEATVVVNIGHEIVAGANNITEFNPDHNKEENETIAILSSLMVALCDYFFKVSTDSYEDLSEELEMVFESVKRQQLEQTK